ncbi:hypothetical protein JZ751_013720 [Albula glossodonta]|uniref:Uncharacterized protein n=1 Tax=Albula glossodonta TaxID=121402 RepID=A0A8T2NTS3_9TELE|nr:hypothetical protein JZ751_013720 [Albula glossodonta]
MGPFVIWSKKKLPGGLPFAHSACFATQHHPSKLQFLLYAPSSLLKDRNPARELSVYVKDSRITNAQPVLRADAAPATRRPLVDVGLDGRQQGGVLGGGGDIQVEVSVTCGEGSGKRPDLNFCIFCRNCPVGNQRRFHHCFEEVVKLLFVVGSIGPRGFYDDVERALCKASRYSFV